MFFYGIIQSCIKRWGKVCDPFDSFLVKYHIELTDGSIISFDFRFDPRASTYEEKARLCKKLLEYENFRKLYEQKLDKFLKQKEKELEILLKNMRYKINNEQEIK